MALRNLARRVITQPTQTRSVHNEVARQIDSMRSKVKNVFDNSFYVNLELLNKTPGQEVDLNKSLHVLNIAPYYDAYRNPRVEILKNKTVGSKDSNNAIVLNSTPVNEVDKFSVEKSKSSLPLSKDNTSDMSSKFYRRTQKDVAYFLSHVPYLFVQDGEVGFSGAKIRVVVDNASAALFLRNMVLSVPKRDAQEFKYNTAVLYAPGYEFTPDRIVEEYGGPKPTDLGLNKDQFLALNEQDSSAVIGGVNNFKLLLDTLFQLSQKTTSSTSDILLASDSAISNDGSVSLFINSTNVVTKSLYKNKNAKLYGAHHNVLNQNGLSRAWSGIMLEGKEGEYKTKIGDIVESFGSGQVRVTSKLPVYANVINTPKSIVFIVNDGSNSVPAVAKVATSLGQDLYTAGMTSVDANSISFTDLKTQPDFFKQYTSNAEFYILNTAAGEEAVTKSVDSILSGKVNASWNPSAQVSTSLQKRVEAMTPKPIPADQPQPQTQPQK